MEEISRSSLDKVDASAIDGPEKNKQPRRLSQRDLRETLRQSELLKRTSCRIPDRVGTMPSHSLSSFLNGLKQVKEDARQRTPQACRQKLLSKPWARHLSPEQQQQLMEATPKLSLSLVGPAEDILIVPMTNVLEKKRLTFVPDAPLASRDRLAKHLDELIARQGSKAWQQRRKQISRPRKIDRVSAQQLDDLRREENAKGTEDDVESDEESTSIQADDTFAISDTEVTSIQVDGQGDVISEMAEERDLLTKDLPKTISRTQQSGKRVKSHYIDDEAFTSDSEDGAQRSDDSELVDEDAIARELEGFIDEGDNFEDSKDEHKALMLKWQLMEDQRQQDSLMRRFGVSQEAARPFPLALESDNEGADKIRKGLQGLRDYADDCDDDNEAMETESEGEELENADELNLSSEHQHALEDLVTLSSDVHVVQDLARKRHFQLSTSNPSDQQAKKKSSLLNMVQCRK